MAISKRWVNFRFLHSKVAWRIFLLFICCAILPLSVLALFSYLNVRSNLNQLSERRLHQASKSTGMTIVERIYSLDMDLQLINANQPAQGYAAPQNYSSEMKARTSARFLSLGVVDENGQALVSLHNGVPNPRPLTVEEKGHLDSGHALLTTSRKEDGGYGVYICRLLVGTGPQRAKIIGEISPDFLWGGEVFSGAGTEALVLGPSKEVLFSTMPPRMPNELEKALTINPATGQFEWADGKNSYYASYWTAFMRPAFFSSFILVHSENRDEVLRPLHSFAWTFVFVVLLTFWVVILASFNQIRRNMVPVELLRDATERIGAGDLSHRVKIESKDEFALLGDSFNAMTQSMEHHVSVMSTMNTIGISLSSEMDDSRILHLILHGAQTVFNADGAALYLLSADEHFRLSMIRVRSLALELTGIEAASWSRFGDTDGVDMGEMWKSAGAAERTISIPDVYAMQEGGFEAVCALDRKAEYHTQSFLSVPLKNHENEVIGFLQLMNAQKRDNSEITSFSTDDQNIAESLASQAAVALTKNRLVHDFKGLFEGLTELVSTAIDEKSAYTGSHVRRVVVLVMMIARAISRSTHPAFKGVHLSADDLYELRIAALLHDCGKLITPTHVIDKSTKLETISDRIELIKLRAEVVRRENRIKLLEEAIHSWAKPEYREEFLQIRDSLSNFDQKLHEDIAFLRACNEGTEWMPESSRERVRSIAARYQWTDEEHVHHRMVTDDELRNLNVPSGTLTPEERDLVELHVVSTMKMLDKLPYPKKLRNIPKYAGTHHERMDGTGYPSQLTGEEIPLPGRIIAIADVFEALTARDRPYKKARTVDEALDILDKMAKGGHVDPDLYHLIIDEKIHLEYGAALLSKTP